MIRVEFVGIDTDRRATRVRLILTGCEGVGCDAGPVREEVRLYRRDG